MKYLYVKENVTFPIISFISKKSERNTKQYGRHWYTVTNATIDNNNKNANILLLKHN